MDDDDRETATQSWVPPSPEELEEHTYESLICTGEKLIVRFEQDRSDRIAEFAIIHMTSETGRWITVARADTCHDQVHVHLLDMQGDELTWTPICEIRSQQDVEDGYDEALDLITDKWEEHKWRWRRGR